MEINHMHSALNAVKLLRQEVGNLFYTISEGVKEEHGEDGKEFVNDVQRIINKVQQRFKDLDQGVNNIPHQSVTMDIQNTRYLGYECNTDKHALYNPLVRSHKWAEKVRKHSAVAHSILSSNSLNKVNCLSFSPMKRKKCPTSNMLRNIPAWEQFVNHLERQHNDMVITTHKSFGNHTVLNVTLGRVLRAMVSFKGTTMETVVIKGFSEDSYNSPTDLMTESRYHVFRKITEHALSFLHKTLFTTNSPDATIKQYFFWLHSYLTLYTLPCKHCGKYTHDSFPPTWRDYKTHEAYHFECKP